MKRSTERTILLLVILFLPILSFAQSKTDYEEVMSRFVRFYNNAQIDSLRTLFDNDSIFCKKKDCEITEWYRTWGEIKYSGLKDSVPYEFTFWTVFSGPGDSTLTFIELNQNKKIQRFSLIGGYR